MRGRIIFAIAKKDLREVSQNKAAWMPMIIVPLVFVIIFPLAFIVIPRVANIPPDFFTSDPEVRMFVEQLPPMFVSTLQGLDDYQTMLVLLLGYMFAPMFLIFPIMFSSVIACESFAGERERKTMEALLYTPATDTELFIGKVGAGLVPAIAISWISFFIYTLVLNGAGWPIFGRFWFPLPGWYPLMFWVAPGMSLLAVSATVLISTRVQTFMGAYQLSASLVVLVLALFFGQISGAVQLSVLTGMLIGVFVWVVAGVFTWLAVRTFNRTRLLISGG